MEAGNRELPYGEHGRPQSVGKYELHAEVGRGNMGRVYLGYDPYVNRRVAIKLADAEQLHDEAMGPTYRRQFFNAAHAAGMLTHPNIVAIYDAGVHGDDCYVVMEYVGDGRTLKQHCRPDSLLPIAEVVEITFKLAKALDYAHRFGVVHRDIKPSNVLIGNDNEVKLGDFGIAFIGHQEATGTMPTMTIGSPRYMSPEQLNEDTLSGQTDVFSLGVMLYELLTGRHPFAADSFSRLIHRILNEDPPPLRSLRSDVPEALEAICRRAMAKRTEERYLTAMDLAIDLGRLLDQRLELAADEVEAGVLFEQLAELEFFRGFSDVELWELVRAGTWVKYEAGHEIVGEGDIDDSFYVIVSGEVGVRRGGYDVRLLKRGDCFGEMGYLAQAARFASIVTRTETGLLKIGGNVIDQVSVNCQNRFLRSFLRFLIQRLSARSEKLNLPAAVA
jgi:hypothetical protein